VKNLRLIVIPRHFGTQSNRGLVQLKILSLCSHVRFILFHLITNMFSPVLRGNQSSGSWDGQHKHKEQGSEFCFSKQTPKRCFPNLSEPVVATLLFFFFFLFLWNSSSDLTKLYSIRSVRSPVEADAECNKTRSQTSVEKLQLSAPKPHSYTRTENPPRTMHLHLRLSLCNLFLRSGISIQPQRLPSS